MNQFKKMITKILTVAGIVGMSVLVPVTSYAGVTTTSTTSTGDQNVTVEATLQGRKTLTATVTPYTVSYTGYDQTILAITDAKINGSYYDSSNVVIDCYITDKDTYDSVSTSDEIKALIDTYHDGTNTSWVIDKIKNDREIEARDAGDYYCLVWVFTNATYDYENADNHIFTKAHAKINPGAVRLDIDVNHPTYTGDMQDLINHVNKYSEFGGSLFGGDLSYHILTEYEIESFCTLQYDYLDYSSNWVRANAIDYDGFKAMAESYKDGEGYYIPDLDDYRDAELYCLANVTDLKTLSYDSDCYAMDVDVYPVVVKYVPDDSNYGIAYKVATTAISMGDTALSILNTATVYSGSSEDLFSVSRYGKGRYGYDGDIDDYTIYSYIATEQQLDEVSNCSYTEVNDAHDGFLPEAFMTWDECSYALNHFDINDYLYINGECVYKHSLPDGTSFYGVIYQDINENKLINFVDTNGILGIAAATDAGTYRVFVKAVPDDPNLKPAYAFVSSTISPCHTSAGTSSRNYTYTGSAINLVEHIDDDAHFYPEVHPSYTYHVMTDAEYADYSYSETTYSYYDYTNNTEVTMTQAEYEEALSTLDPMNMSFTINGITYTNCSYPRSETTNPRRDISGYTYTSAVSKTDVGTYHILVKPDAGANYDCSPFVYDVSITACSHHDRTTTSTPVDVGTFPSSAIYDSTAPGYEYTYTCDDCGNVEKAYTLYIVAPHYEMMDKDAHFCYASPRFAKDEEDNLKYSAITLTINYEDGTSETRSVIDSNYHIISENATSITATITYAKTTPYVSSRDGRVADTYRYVNHTVKLTDDFDQPMLWKMEDYVIAGDNIEGVNVVKTGVPYSVTDFGFTGEKYALLSGFDAADTDTWGNGSFATTIPTFNDEGTFVYGAEHTARSHVFDLHDVSADVNYHGNGEPTPTTIVDYTDTTLYTYGKFDVQIIPWVTFEVKDLIGYSNADFTVPYDVANRIYSAATIFKEAYIKGTDEEITFYSNRSGVLATYDNIPIKTYNDGTYAYYGFERAFDKSYYGEQTDILGNKIPSYVIGGDGMPLCGATTIGGYIDAYDHSLYHNASQPQAVLNLDVLDEDFATAILLMDIDSDPAHPRTGNAWLAMTELDSTGYTVSLIRFPSRLIGLVEYEEINTTTGSQPSVKYIENMDPWDSWVGIDTNNLRYLSTSTRIDSIVPLNGGSATYWKTENNRVYLNINPDTDRVAYPGGCIDYYVPQYVSNHVHTPGEPVIENNVDPDCDNPGGYDTVTYCEDCGAELSRVHTDVPALGHTRGQLHNENVVDPTCTTAGSHDEVVRCTTCNDIIESTHVVDPALGHDPKDPEYENVVDATCTTTGGRDVVVYCDRCGAEISREHEIIPALGHNPGTPVKERIVDATCTTEGSYDLVTYCTRCREILSTEHVVVPAFGHTPGEPKKIHVIEATCEHEGSYDLVVYCDTCGEVLSEEHKTVEKTGHIGKDPVYENIVDPTCVSNGSRDKVTYCKFCGGEMERTKEEIPALGHIAGEKVIEDNVDPTCTENGHYHEVTYCDRCHEKLSDEFVTVPLLGHKEGLPVIENRVNAEIGKAGSYDEVIYCDRCHLELSRIRYTIDPLTEEHVHDYVEVERKDPTCTEGGYIKYVCTCNDIRIDYLDPLGHLPGEPVVENRIEPENGVDGSYDMVIYCERCGEELSRETMILPAIPIIHDDIKTMTDELIKKIAVTTSAVTVSGGGIGAFFFFFWWRRRKIKGYIVDKNGNAGYTVTLKGKDNLEMITAEDGMFIFKNLKEDDYLFTVTNPDGEEILSAEVYTKAKFGDEMFTVINAKVSDYDFRRRGKTILMDVDI